MSKNNKNHGITCVFILLILVEIVNVYSSDKIIFNNKMHEIDDVGTNELSLIFVTRFYNFMPKYFQCLID